jgi:LacI family transcriptional regulator
MNASDSAMIVRKEGARITHSTIAAHLGVSRSAVTEALHGSRKSNLRPELRHKIIKAAREMNYRPRNITTHNIGFVSSVEELKLETVTTSLVKIDHVLRNKGYRLTLASLHSDDPQLLSQTLNPKTVDGVIFTSWYGGKIRDVLAPEIPWVLTSAEDGVAEDVDVVTLDVAQILGNLTRYLMSYGHRTFCLVTGPERIGFHRRMTRSMHQVISEGGLDPTLLKVIAVEHDEEIAPGFKTLMGRPDRPTAVIAASPEKSLTVLYHLRSMGLHVPRDVSIVSVVDSYHFRAYDPVLTAAQWEEEVAERAVRRLLEKIDDPESLPQKILLPGRIVEWESVGPAPASSGGAEIERRDAVSISRKTSGGV